MDETVDLTFVGKIAESFKLSGRFGIVVVPQSAWVTPLVIGSKLVLVKPDSEILPVEIVSLELVRTVYAVKTGVAAVSIESDGLTKEEVPIGSTLWLV